MQKCARSADANTNAIKQSVNESFQLGVGTGIGTGTGQHSQLSLSLLLSLLGEASLKRCGNGSGNNATVADAGQIVERPCEYSAVLGSSRDQAKLGLTSLRFSSLHAVFV